MRLESQGTTLYFNYFNALVQVWQIYSSQAACGSLPSLMQLLHSCWILWGFFFTICAHTTWTCTNCMCAQCPLYVHARSLGWRKWLLCSFTEFFLKMAGNKCRAKWKYEEHRTLLTEWDTLFFVECNGKPFCLICQASLAHLKASNLLRHFTSLYFMLTSTRNFQRELNFANTSWSLEKVRLKSRQNYSKNIWSAQTP